MPQPQPQTSEVTPLSRVARFHPETVNEEARTVEISWGVGAPVERFDGWSGESFLEELSMDPAHIRMESITSGRAPFTRDHRRGIDNVIGVIDSASVTGGESRATVRFSKREDVDPTWRDVKDGILRNTSVTYRTYAVERIESEARGDMDTLLAVDWEPIAVGLVDIGADLTSSVRSGPDQVARNQCKMTTRNLPAAPAAARKENPMPGPAEVQPQDDAAQKIKDAEKRAAEAEAKVVEVTERADRAALTLRINDQAASMGVELSSEDVEGCRDYGEGADLIMSEHAKRSKPPESGHVITVNRDERDGLLKRAQDAYCGDFARALSSDMQKDIYGRQFGVRDHASLRTRELIQRCYDLDGIDTRGTNDTEFYTRAVQLSRAANQTTSSFSYILNNVATMNLLAGFEATDNTWSEWAGVGDLTDFKQAQINGLANGNLTQTAEGVAFPELGKADGGYNAQLQMWGATVNLTFQALTNDSALGEFARMMGRAGGIAARTVDKEVYTRLLNATWTNDTTTGATLATSTNLDKVRKGFRGKLNPAGEKMQNSPKYVLVDSLNTYNAEVATGEISANGATTVASTRSRQLRVIESDWIGDANLKSGALTTDYYLAGTAGLVDTVTARFLGGQRSPIIMPFDVGATAAEAWKIMLPFSADVATHTDSEGDLRVTGIQKATVA